MLDYYSRFPYDLIIAASKDMTILERIQKKLCERYNINRRNVEILNQEVLLEILLKFQEDLKNGWSNTFEKYATEFKYILPMETELPMKVTMLVQLSYSN